MKAVVFGGAGFIGSHVADSMQAAGYDVTVFDHSSSPWLVEGQTMVVGDILDREKVEEAVKDATIVFHGAAIANIDYANSVPLAAIETNVQGTAIILESCRQAGVERFVFASSLYANSSAGGAYRATKQCAEILIDLYGESYGLPYTILRFGSLYGPRAGMDNFIYRIITSALKERRVVREGDGEEIREYIHVRDAARCVVEVLVPEYENEVVVISGHQATRVRDLLTTINEMLGGDVEIVYEDVAPGLHYQVTPYSFKPRVAFKHLSGRYHDLGQGLLECMREISAEDSEGPAVESPVGFNEDELQE